MGAKTAWLPVGDTALGDAASPGPVRGDVGRSLATSGDMLRGETVSNALVSGAGERSVEGVEAES